MGNVGRQLPKAHRVVGCGRRRRLERALDEGDGKEELRELPGTQDASDLRRESPAAPERVHEALACARIGGEMLHRAVDACVVADHDLRPPEAGRAYEALGAGGDLAGGTEPEERRARADGARSGIGLRARVLAKDTELC